jgi:hypothetical protein
MRKEDDIFDAVAKLRESTKPDGGISFTITRKPEGFIVVRHVNATGEVEYVALCPKEPDAVMISKALNRSFGQAYCDLCFGYGSIQCGPSEQPCPKCLPLATAPQAGAERKTERI